MAGKIIPSVFMTRSAVALPSKARDFQYSERDKHRKNLLTVHYHPHILEEATDDLESLRCGYPSLVRGESV